MGTSIERLHRWADRLPASEPIPINESEMYEVAEHFVGFERCPSQAAKTFLLGQLRGGTFKFADHPVIVLKDGPHAIR